MSNAAPIGTKLTNHNRRTLRALDHAVRLVNGGKHTYEAAALEAEISVRTLYRYIREAKAQQQSDRKS